MPISRSSESRSFIPIDPDQCGVGAPLDAFLISVFSPDVKHGWPRPGLLFGAQMTFSRAGREVGKKCHSANHSHGGQQHVGLSTSTSTMAGRPSSEM
jgi:hypothetical protein